MQGEADVRVLGAQVLEHPHLEAVVAQRALPSSGWTRLTATNRGSRSASRRPTAIWVKTRSGELPRETWEIHRTGSRSPGRAAGVAPRGLAELGVGGVGLADGLGDDLVELSARDELAVEGGEVGVVAHGLGELARAVGGGVTRVSR